MKTPLVPARCSKIFNIWTSGFDIAFRSWNLKQQNILSPVNCYCGWSWY
jgi:hypothetical protein